MSDRDSICANEEKPVEYRLVVGFENYRVGDDGSVWYHYPDESNLNNAVTNLRWDTHAQRSVL